MKKYWNWGFSGLLATMLIACGGQDQAETTAEGETETATEAVKEVNVYSHRYYDADKVLFEKFTEKTGIKVNVKEDKATKLIASLQAEGENTTADVLLTVDAGNLYYAKELGLFQSVNSEVLDAIVPANLTDVDKQWFGLAKRARVFAYDKTKLTGDAVHDYMDVLNEEWSHKILVRQSNNLYNQSLLASIIANYGEEKALEWAKAVVSNMARDPQGNDRDQIKALALGEGDLAIVNTYYLGKLVSSSNEMEQEAAKNIGFIFPDAGTGTHINVSGGGVVKYAPHPDHAVAFLEFLVSEEAQKIWAESNYEYPVNSAVAPSELVASWGELTEDSLSLVKLGELNARAKEIFKEAGWN